MPPPYSLCPNFYAVSCVPKYIVLTMGQIVQLQMCVYPVVAQLPQSTFFLSSGSYLILHWVQILMPCPKSLEFFWPPNLKILPNSLVFPHLLVKILHFFRHFEFTVRYYKKGKKRSAIYIKRKSIAFFRTKGRWSWLCRR